jgi:protein-S-isoprenylcysteine O-methyltransferase Ste14
MTGMTDLAARAALIFIFAVFGTLGAQRIVETWATLPVVDLTAMALKLVFLVLVVALAIFRRPPVRSASGWEPRVSALLGTFLLLALGALEQPELHPAVRWTASAWIVLGSLLALCSLWWLGRSFSIMAQARKLVTAGPYHLVRHPLYASEAIAAVGVVLNQFSLTALALFLAQLGFQLRRIHNEECVLASQFPEYRSYAQSTPMLIPRMFRAQRKSA